MRPKVVRASILRKKPADEEDCRPQPPAMPRPETASPARMALKSAMKRKSDLVEAAITGSAVEANSASGGRPSSSVGFSMHERRSNAAKSEHEDLVRDVAKASVQQEGCQNATNSHASFENLHTGRRLSDAESEFWDGEDDDEGRIGKRMSQSTMMGPLCIQDDTPETWSARNLCIRAYHQAYQRDLWKVRTAEEEGEGGARISGRACRDGGEQHFAYNRRRCSTHQNVVALDCKLLSKAMNAGDAARSSDAATVGRLGHCPKIQRATSVFILDTDEGDHSDEKVEDEDITNQADSTGAPKTLEVGEAAASEDNAVATADTGGTPPLAKVSPLKELLTAKKVDIARVRSVLESEPDIGRWINAPLDVASQGPTPLIFAMGATLPALVGLLLEFRADVRQAYDGPKMYMGWIKSGVAPIEAVTNRKGRFVGTMLADRLEEILEIMKLADARYGVELKAETVNLEIGKKIEKITQKKDSLPSNSSKMQVRKSIKLMSARGVVQHTQGHPCVKYDVVRDLGEGSLSSIKLAVTRKTGEMRTIKAEMKVEEAGLWDEIAIMRKLYHPNVIQLFETFEDDSNIFVVLEYCAGGELFSRLAQLGGIPERDAATNMQQLGSAVKYIHDEKVCHRDIQPENFLLKESGPFNEATVKLIDFTTAKEFGSGVEMKTKICTLHYVAPEILTRKSVSYTEKVDVWSLGVVFYVMLCGSPPFHAEDELGTLKKIKKGAYKFDPPNIWENISQHGKDLVQKMLVIDADARYSATDVVSHKWLNTERMSNQRTTQPANNLMTAEQLHNLRNFHAMNRVHKVVLRLKAQRLSSTAVEELRTVFRRLDKHGTGEVHVSQIRDKIMRVAVLREYIEEIMRILWSLEQGKAGLVKFDKFLDAVVARHGHLQKEACRAVFDVFDLDGSGTISQEELKMALGFGSDNRTFMDGIETVFGMKADKIEERFNLSRAEYSFDEFYDMMYQQVC